MGALALRPADLRDFDGEARVQDLRLGEVLGFASAVDIRKLIRRSMTRLERHGEVFATVAKTSLKGGRPATEYYLNERQAYRLCMFSDAPNAEAVQEQMVEVFLAYRHGQIAPATQRRTQRSRKGFGRMSSINRLPESCADDVVWARAALEARQMPQNQVLEELNRRITAKGAKRISTGAFSRWSISLAVELRRLEESRRVTDDVIARLGPGDLSNGFIATAEILRERLTSIATVDADPSPRSAGTVALALQRLERIAMRGTGKRLNKQIEGVA